MKKKTRTPKRRSSRKKQLGRYASNLEKYCADQLKEYGLAFDYEEHQFELMDRFRFPNKYFKMTAKGKEMADRSGSVVLPITYKPDFVGRDHDWIIETKGYLPLLIASIISFVASVPLYSFPWTLPNIKTFGPGLNPKKEWVSR